MIRFFIYKSTILPLRLFYIFFIWNHFLDIFTITKKHMACNAHSAGTTAASYFPISIWYDIDMFSNWKQNSFYTGKIFFLIQPIIKNIHNHFHSLSLFVFLLILKYSDSSWYIHMLYNLVRHNIELLDIEIISLDGKAYIWVTIDIVVRK